MDFGKEHFARDEIVGLFSATLGAEKSHETVDQAALRLGLSRATLTVEETIRLLEDLAGTSGVVGLVSKLATARLRAALVMRGLNASKHG